MPSSIDPTRPQDGVSASKADLRAALQTIKTEIEHGGFFQHPAPGALESTVADALGGMWVNVKTQFGAVGDGTTDDRPALQAAFDSGWPLWFPPGDYRVYDSLTYNGNINIKGAGGKPGSGNIYSRIRGTFAKPTIHRQGIYVDHNNQRVGTVQTGVGFQFCAEDIVFHNTHVQGCCIQTFNVAAPEMYNRCTFELVYRGLLLTNSFGALVSNCWFKGVRANVKQFIADNNEHNAVALALGQCCTTVACDFQSCGTAIFAFGTQANVFGGRAEVCGIGMRLGGPSLDPQEGVLGVNWPLTRSTISGFSMEANYKGIWVFNTAHAVTISDITLQGGVSAVLLPGEGNLNERASLWGLYIANGSRTATIRNINMAGRWSQAAIVHESGNPKISGLHGSNSWNPDTAPGGTRLTYQGMSTFWSRRATGDGSPLFWAQAYPVAPRDDVALTSDSSTITAFHDLQIRGLKGLNIRDPNVLPRNFGGIQAVSAGTTSVAVTFPTGATASASSINAVPTVSGGGSLPAGTYYYGSSPIGKNGEAGFSVTSLSNNYREVVVASDNSQITLSLSGGLSANFKRRVYRGPSMGIFNGFWELPNTQTSFTDTGSVAFTGYDGPPGSGIQVPTQVEDDANYAVIVTPSWPATNIHVHTKLTTGFTIEWTGTAPAGGMVQWLLYRP